jgi:cytochrome oxidase assembly protein ShyY1
VYRFLLGPRWILGALLTIMAAAAMVLLGNWQLSRYHERTAINERIQAGERAAPVAVSSLLAAPAAHGRPGAAPSADRHWA